MKIVKDINKMIVRKVIEIVFVFAFILGSAQVWRSEKTQEMLNSIAVFSNASKLSLQVKNQINYSMYPMTDERAMEKLVPCTLTVKNETYSEENYTLVLKIDKSSTLDYNYLHISIDDTIYALNALEKEITNKEIVFILDRNSLLANQKEYEIRLWLNTLAGNDLQAKNLSMQFDIIDETTNV